METIYAFTVLFTNKKGNLNEYTFDSLKGAIEFQVEMNKKNIDTHLKRVSLHVTWTNNFLYLFNRCFLASLAIRYSRRSI